MKVVHFTSYNASGMNRVAESIVTAERAAGLDSHLLNIAEQSDWEVALDADVHVSHTHFPDFKDGKSFLRMLKKPAKIVAFFHGTPEFVFTDTVNSFKRDRHWGGDGLQMLYHWLKTADARVTFWPRHQAIYQQLVDRGTEVDCLPLGVDSAFWAGGTSKGRWAGDPCVFSAENPHHIKWPLDLITAWSWIYPQLENASLSLGYVAEDLHRQFAPWITNTGAGYGMRWSASYWNPADLRDIFKSVDFFTGLVRYGDFNHLSLQAAASGLKTVSYRGNPYADYWVTEGDQRVLAAELLDIFRGNATPRAKSSVPEIAETVAALAPIYERVLARTIVPGFSLPFKPCTSWLPKPETIVIPSVVTESGNPKAFAEAMNALEIPKALEKPDKKRNANRKRNANKKRTTNNKPAKKAASARRAR